jgi:hypothetical protein
VGIRNCKKPRWFLKFTMAVLEKNPEWVLKTQPPFIYAQKTTISKMHMDQGFKNHGGRNYAPNRLLKLSSWKTKIFG